MTTADVEGAAGSGPGTVEPLRGVRRAMAANMARAHRDVVPATVHDLADVAEWAPGTDPTVRLLRAVGVAATTAPTLNAEFLGPDQGRRIHEQVHVGVAVETEDGLFVPVLRDVTGRDLADLRAGLDRLRADVAARSIPAEELTGATITLSNFGMHGGLHASLVVIPPQVAIVGAGRLHDAVVARGGTAVVRRSLPISLTFDHRVVTGVEGDPVPLRADRRPGVADLTPSPGGARCTSVRRRRASDTVITDPFLLADDLGPAKVVHLTERSTGLRAVVVIDNVAAGPAIGGVRMAPDVTAAECFGLARAMTLKNAAAGLAHGGAKSVIRADPAMAPADKERLVRAFACAMADLTDYIPGPDMGTDELAMGWVHDEIGRAIGLPAELGGIPLDVLGATGFGLAVAVEVAAPRAGLDLDGARVAVQGFGAVGSHVARFLVARGCRIVGASDSSGAVVDPAGLDVDALVTTTRSGRGLVDQADVEHIERDDLIGVECDIWVPAARPDAIRGDNVDRLRARMVAQGANIGVTLEAEERLHAMGVLSLPDFIVNAGGVICGAVEFAGGSPALAFAAIESRIRENLAEVLDRAARSNGLPVDAAHEMAESRVRRAMATRRWA